MASKDPAFLFYSSDFLVGTMGMDDATVGKYIKLLCLMHQKGPMSAKKIIDLIGEFSEDLQEKFKINDEKLYFNERLENERKKRAKHSEKQRQNVLKRWNKKKNTTVIPKSYGGNTNVLPLENENENEIVNRNKDNFRKGGVGEKPFPDFQDFWDLYDKKVDKKKTKFKWNKLTDWEKDEIMEYLPLYRQTTPDKKFRKDPVTFLNNESWKNEIILTPEQSKMQKQKERIESNAKGWENL